MSHIIQYVKLNAREGQDSTFSKIIALSHAYDHPHGGILYPGCQIPSFWHPYLALKTNTFLKKKKKVVFFLFFFNLQNLLQLIKKIFAKTSY